MIWLLSQIFGQFVPLLNFLGDHRYGAVAVLLIAAAVAAWAYLPVVGGRMAKILFVGAVAFGCFDWGYSHRAAIDREAWQRAEAARLAAELAEHARRDAELDKARRDADLTAQALAVEQQEHARYQMEMENASRANDQFPCLDRAGILRLDRIGGRKKAR